MQLILSSRAYCKELLHLTPEKITVPSDRFNHVHLDIVLMPFHQNFRYCLTMIDRFTRWPEVVPLTSISADTVLSSNQGCSRNWFTSWHTTAYHPQSNGMVERWHRSFKAAMMCHSGTPWPELLLIVLLGLRTCLKEDLKSSAAEMLYGTTIRMPNEFFEDLDVNVDPATFIGDFRDLMRKIRSTPSAHHSKQKMFRLKEIDKCSHVFIRTDAVKLPLEPPYSGPFEGFYRNSDRVFTLNVNGKAVSVDRIKPAFLAKTDTQQDAQPEIAVQPQTYQNKRVQFNVS
ncbi:uncharacterized protein LOC121467597 [Drosophila elegans]|uniref:uncharacterized protein LOC121467597 n=1 Tax=Drosophila elegans TaxID=30023 RepID=UPI001BC83FB1|nr:uncharacterized protein LOC121467597 [Drosophila elegans]